MPAISVLMKPASGMCNMKCDYCFYCDEAKKRSQESFGFMSEETLKNVIRKTLLRAEGMASYAFQGGEPSLRGVEFFEKVIEYQKKYNKNNVRIDNAFQTNGYGIDEKWCELFRKHHFLVGISVDGVKKTHDLYRHTKDGNETFERILHTTQLFDQYEVEYNILTVVNQKTAENIEEIYAFYRNQGWRFQQYIACLEPLSEPRGESDYAITPQQYGQFLTRLFKMWHKDWKRNRQPYIRQFENYIGILVGQFPEACDQRGICGMQNVVEADGSVYPCDFYMMDEYRLGNFNENRLDEINQKRKEINFIERSEMINQKCRECRYYGLCRGGCQRNRDWDNETESYRNYFCEGYRIFFDACLEEMKQVAKSISI